MTVARTVAFYDGGANALRGVDAPEESVIHVTVVGIIHHDPDSAGDTI
ncbi:MAG: hypothetical protein J7J06_03710 [Methanosarcinales archaeon]|nr:hypothetical protein [Methanosarcinales archaeon]